MQSHSALNGHATGSQPTPGGRRIEVFRPDGPEPVFVRMLAPDYKGIFTHYYQKRSVYCEGDDCKIPTHKNDRVWKGYTPAERLEIRNGKGFWVPCCLEITENLELDFRFGFARGQLWELWRDASKKGKKLPVTGKLHADPPPSNLRAPFDILPCLRALYHRDRVNLVHGSPLPDRVFIEETEAELPQALQPASPQDFQKPEGFESYEAERQRRLAMQKKSPSEQPRSNKFAY